MNLKQIGEGMNNFVNRMVKISIKKQRNIDKIKSMNIDEMATFISMYIDCDKCFVSDICKNTKLKTCTSVVERWLQSEAEEG